jgi:hypothetical protein
MHVIWNDGLAERKGIGQILGSALEDAVGTEPCLKQVLLG